MQNRKVSIVTVSYNSVACIEKTILSVLGQTYPDIEYIIIDGGSSDGTVDIIKKYSGKISYWVSEPDKGIYNAMNKGLSRATGSWINFMNAGDTFHQPDTIEQFLGNVPEGTVVAYGQNLRILSDCSYISPRQELDLDKLAVMSIIPHQSTFISLDYHKKHPFDESLAIAGDYKFFHTAYFKDKVRFSFIHNVVADYDGENGASKTRTMSRLLAIAKEEYQARGEAYTLPKKAGRWILSAKLALKELMPKQWRLKRRRQLLERQGFEILERPGTGTLHIPEKVSRHVLVVGEYYKDVQGGGVVSVIRSHSRYYDVFNFIASYRNGSFLNKIVFDLGGLFKLFLKCLSPTIRIVHIHTAANGSFFKHIHYMRVAKRMGKTVILHVHGSEFKKMFEDAEDKKRILDGLALADLLIVLSSSWKEWFSGIGFRNTVVLNNIVEPPTIQPSDETGKLQLLFLGEIGPRKGIFDVLDAIHENIGLFTDRLSLKIAGNHNEESLTAKIKELQLDGIVSFEGFASGQKKVSLLNWADALILASFNEGLPISILEAMTYSCAIISTPVGGIPEVVGKDNGILVTPGNKSEIASSIREMIERKQDGTLKKMGENSFSKVQAFLPHQVIEQLNGIYAGLL